MKQHGVGSLRKLEEAGSEHVEKLTPWSFEYRVCAQCCAEIATQNESELAHAARVEIRERIGFS